MVGFNVAARAGALLSALILGGLLAVPVQAHAQDTGKPLYEVEAVGLVGYTPDYPGSSQMHAHFLPLPWLSYRGSFLRTDQQGSVQGRLVETPRFGLDLSVQGAFPVSSTDNTARDGMPDLDWIGEAGPKARFTLHRWVNEATAHTARVNLELPVRGVFSTDLSSITYRGLIASPAITYDNNKILGGRLKLSLGAMFGTEELTGYFYDVDPAHATAARPAYDSRAGYMGMRAGLGLSVPVGDRVTVMGKSTFDLFDGSANADSPLMKSTTNVGVMLGMSVSLYRSARIASSER